MSSAAAVVYLVTNRVNGHTYVGVTRFTPEHRWAQHVGNARRPRSYLHRAIAKYGAENFVVEVIASCLSVQWAGYIERLLIQRLKPTYNQTDGGEVTEGRRFSDESRRRISETKRGQPGTPHSQESRDKIGDRHRGKVLSSTTRALISQAHRGKKDPRSEQGRLRCNEATAVANARRVWSVESCVKASISRSQIAPDLEQMACMWKKNQRSVVCVTTGDVFDSVKNAAEYFGVSPAAISNVCAGRYASVKKLVFSYQEQGVSDNV